MARSCGRSAAAAGRSLDAAQAESATVATMPSALSWRNRLRSRVIFASWAAEIYFFLRSISQVRPSSGCNELSTRLGRLQRVVQDSHQSLESAFSIFRVVDATAGDHPP